MIYGLGFKVRCVHENIERRKYLYEDCGVYSLISTFTKNILYDKGWTAEVQLYP